MWPTGRKRQLPRCAGPPGRPSRSSSRSRYSDVATSASAAVSRKSSCSASIMFARSSLTSAAGSTVPGDIAVNDFWMSLWSAGVLTGSARRAEGP